MQAGLSYSSPQLAAVRWRLTALWAFAESGLGGFMHAFQLPFTGFFLGAFAIVILTIMSEYSDHIRRDLLQATALVLVVKLMASPHSPPTAYVAVGFQGIVSALFLHYLPTKWGAPLAGGIALLESAVQKLIILTLVFGMNFWEALQQLFQSILRSLSISGGQHFSWWIIVLFSMIHVVWGIFWGSWAARFAPKIPALSEQIMHQQTLADTQNIQPQKGSKKYIVWIYILFLAIILSAFLLNNQPVKAMYALGRAVAGIILLFFVIGPVLQYLLQRIRYRQSGKRLHKALEIIQWMPQIKPMVQQAYVQASPFSGIKKLREFVRYLILLIVFIPGYENK